MPLPSRIVPPPSDGDESHFRSDHHDNWAHSVSPARINSRSVLKDDPRAHRHSGSASAYNHDSRIASSVLEDDPHAHRHSGSASAYNHGSRIASSAPGDTHHYNTGSRSKPTPGPRQHSHISVSSDDSDTDTTEIIMLRNENLKLKLDLAHLQGRFEGLVYVLIHYVLIPR